LDGHVGAVEVKTIAIGRFKDMVDKFEKHRLLAWKTPPVRQHTQHSCWAACIEWWTKALLGGRPQMSQDQIRRRYAGLAQNDGKMLPSHLVRILKEPQWMANVVLSEGLRTIREKLELGPMIVGYTDVFYVAGHANVLVAPSLSYPDHFIVMEPATGVMTHKSYGKYTSSRRKLVAAWPRV
jgi:hypothetical protein